MKRFKYLYFTNVLNKPYFNFWFLKKLKGGKEDDGNLLTEPADVEYGGVKWSWNKFNATGYGKYTSSGGKMTNVLPLKETLEGGTKCKFSIKEPLTYGLRLTLSGTNNVRLVLNAGETSVEGTVGSGVSITNFQIFNLATRGTVIDETIKGFKLVKVS